MAEVMTGELLPAPAGPEMTGELMPADQQPLSYITSGNTKMTLDPQNEAPAYARMLGSIKMSKEGLFGFLESIAGKGNVFQDSQGDLYLRDPNNPEKVVPYNKAGFTMRDIAGLAGTAIELAPAAKLAKGASAVKAGIGALIGEGAKMGISEALPGSDNMSLTERGADLAVAAGSGILGQGAVNVGGAVIGEVASAIRGAPFKFLGNTVQKSAATPYGQEGERLTQSTGIDLSLGEQTGNKMVRMGEGMAGRSLTGATQFFDFQQKQLGQALTKLDSTLSGVGPKEGPLTLGTSVNKAFADAWEKADGLRQTQAKVDFGTLDSVGGNTPVIPTENVINAINARIKNYQVPGLVSDPQKIIAGLEKWRDSVPAYYTGKQYSQVLSAWSKGAKGSGDLVGDMETAASRQIYAELLGATEKDLETAVTTGGRTGSVAKALETARNNYKTNSDAMRQLGDSTLAAITKSGDATPEAVTAKISAMKYPSEIASTMSILDKQNPLAAEQVRRQVMENAISKAKEPTTTTGASGLSFSANTFVKNLPDEAVLSAYGFSPKAIGEVKDVGAALERISKKEFQGSPTAPLGMAWDVLLGAFTLNAAVLGRLGGTVLLPRLIAKATLTPEGRQALLTLSSPSSGGQFSKRMLGAALYMTGIATKDKAQSNMDSFQAPAAQQMQEAQ